ncbi:MAG TPA: dihydroorotate dehydrogenase electron transfer subunit [Candidatus Syntrophosphaera sp.]|jgi:dihydroorotate dehydrogenase electron transfer subunit|nr:dihydroorotate dehydrogenase electron transfer subunit [Candidatus Syntrophosphaera sp.]
MISCKTLPLAENRQLNASYRVLVVRDAEMAANCRPGMFCELKAAVPEQERKLFKPVSVYGVSGDEVSFLIKVIGPGTASLAALQPGDPLQVLGLLGNGFPIVENKMVLLVSGGVGYPPLAYLREFLESDNDIHFLHGGACAEDVFPCDEVFTDDGCAGKRGFVTDGVDKLLAEKNIDVVFSCGPLPMLKKLAQLVAPLPHYCSLEAYMACGVGVCHGCAVPVGEDYSRVCKEGPVFEAAQVRWGEI